MSERVIIPENYDYVGIYLTEKCHLACSYCITKHHNSSFGNNGISSFQPDQWVDGLNRLELPDGVPLTLQGGEPFLYKGIWDILDNVTHKIDILTALPPFLSKDDFLKLKSLDWNKRETPYPTIRVSYHKGQNQFKDLVNRVSLLQEVLSIGIYFLNGYDHKEGEIQEMKNYAKAHGVELREKEYLGHLNGEHRGTYLYEGAADGVNKGIKVFCKNSVVPVAPDGNIYRCHSDLYFSRKKLSIGNINKDVQFPKEHLECNNYGLCSECDVKVKTNHHQIYGYTSVDIKFM